MSIILARHGEQASKNIRRNGIHKFLLNTAVASALILSVILIYSNNGLINAESEMHVSFLSHTCNRNTVAFGCVPGLLCAAERRRRRLGKGSALCARTLGKRRRRKAAL